MGIIQNYLWGQTYDMFDSKWMSKYMKMKSKIKFNMPFIYCCGFQFQDFCQNFFNATNTVQLLMGKIQPNVELTI